MNPRMAGSKPAALPLGYSPVEMSTLSELAQFFHKKKLTTIKSLISFVFNGCWWLGSNVKNYPIDTLYFADNSLGTTF